MLDVWQWLFLQRRTRLQQHLRKWGSMVLLGWFLVSLERPQIGQTGLSAAVLHLNQRFSELDQLFMTCCGTGKFALVLSDLYRTQGDARSSLGTMLGFVPRAAWGSGGSTGAADVFSKRCAGPSAALGEEQEVAQLTALQQLCSVGMVLKKKTQHL